MSYDAINIPKLGALTICAAMVLALLVTNFRLFSDLRYRPLLLASGLFALDLLVLLVLHRSPFSEHFYGTFGRNTGFLAYISLLILFIASAMSFRAKSTEKLLWALVGTGLVSAMYGVLQSVGLDPYHWASQYSPVFGFLGNPDFQSSFLGICGVAIFAIIIRPKERWRLRAVLGVVLVLLLYVILKTKAQQGFLVLATGSAFVLYIFFYKNQRLKKFTIPYVVLSTLAAGLVLTGSLNKGPLAHYLYKLSVTYRGDYWSAGWKMTLQHPLAGIGLDSYGEWYRFSRTVAATLRRGPDMVSNSAHNVLLDFSSNGGFPFLLVYLLLVGITMRSAFRFIKRSESFDAIHAGLFGAWIAYQVQSLISLNQLGLAVWGWILAGALIAYEISSRPIDQGKSDMKYEGKVSKARNVKIARNSLPTASIAIFVGFLIGLVLALPPFLADAKFRASLKSGSAAVLVEAVTQRPIDNYLLVLGAQIMRKSKLDAFGLDLAKFALKRDVRTYDAWREIRLNVKATAVEKAGALRQMKILDPHNPTLK